MMPISRIQPSADQIKQTVENLQSNPAKTLKYVQDHKEQFTTVDIFENHPFNSKQLIAVIEANAKNALLNPDESDKLCLLHMHRTCKEYYAKHHKLEKLSENMTSILNFPNITTQPLTTSQIKDLATLYKQTVEEQSFSSKISSKIRERMANVWLLPIQLISLATSWDTDKTIKVADRGIWKKQQEVTLIQGKTLNIFYKQCTQDAKDLTKKNKEIETLQNGLTQKNKDIQNLQKSLTHKDEEIQNLEQKLQDLQLKLSSQLKKKNEEIKNLQETKNQEINNLQEEVKKLKEQMELKDQEIANFKKQIADLTQHTQKIEGKINDLNENLDHYKSDIYHMLEGQFKQHLEANEEKINLKDQETTALKKQVANLTQELANFQGQMKDLIEQFGFTKLENH